MNQEAGNCLIQKVCSKLNDYALKQLHSENIQIALTLFSVEEELLQSYSQLDHIQRQVDLYNNQSCCYRKLGQLETAKIYLQKAIKISYDNRGLSYLNLCAILSQMGQHKKALKVANLALIEVIH